MLFFKKKFPNDEVGEQLSTLYKKGINFKEKQVVLFNIAVPGVEEGNKILELIRQKGFEGKSLYNEKQKTYRCICSKVMMLDYDELINIQKILNKLSSPYDGYIESWDIK